MTKSQYAAYRGVRPSSVSNWLKSGRLSQRSLVGHGYGARIKVAEADKELAANQDLRSTLAPSPAGGNGVAPAIDPDDPARRYQIAKAEQAEHDSELSRRKLKAQDGTYVFAEQARSAWTKELAAFARELEAWLPDLAQELAAAPSEDRGVVLARLRKSLRRFRTRVSEQAGVAAADEPELVSEPRSDAHGA